MATESVARGQLARSSMILPVVVALAAVPLLVAVTDLMDGWRALGDNAIIGLRVDGIWRGHLPLTGLVSTGENYGSGVESNHPGPMALYLLAPFTLLFGPHVGLALGAASVNAASFATVGWAAARRGGLTYLLAAAVGLCVLARGLGTHLLIDPISSNQGTFPALAFVMLTWAVLSGDDRLLPFAVGFGTFTLQSHLTYVAIGGSVAAVLVGGLLLRHVRWQQRPDDRTLIVSGVVAAVLWAPVLIDQFFVSGNISSIVRTFTSGDAVGSGYGFALDRAAYALGAPPLFARTTVGLSFLDDPSTLTALLAVVVLALFVVGSLVPIQGRLLDRRLRPYAVVVLALLAVSIFSAASLPNAATLKAANLRWMWLAGLLVWLGVAWAGLRLVARFAPQAWSGVRDKAGVVVIGVLAVGVAGVFLQGQDRPARDAQATEASEALAAIAGDARTATYRVAFQGGPALLTVGPGFAYDLASDGSTVLVDAGAFTRTYGEAIAYVDQQVAGSYLVAAGDVGTVVLPEGFDELLRTSYPSAVGSDTSVEVVLGYQEGEVVASAQPAPQPENLPAGDFTPFCGAVAGLSAELTTLLEGSDGTAGEAVEALGLLTAKPIDPNVVPEASRPIVQDLYTRLPTLLATLRSVDPGQKLESVTIDPLDGAAFAAVSDLVTRVCPN